jgi:hypothetical protein
MATVRDAIVRSHDRSVGEVTVFHLPPAPGEYPHQAQQALKVQAG